LTAGSRCDTGTSPLGAGHYAAVDETGLSGGRHRTIAVVVTVVLFALVSGALTTKCQSGRGHQDFDTSLCS
jgi:hypothetical protein